MIVYDVRLQNDTLQRLIASFEHSPDITARHIMRAANQSVVSYHGTARQLAPIDQGPLRNSIQITPARRDGNRIEASVGTNLHYAEAQEAGSGIYGPTGSPIRPKRAKILAWHSGGQWHFAKSVKGVRPKWYMRGSVEQNQGNTNRYFATAADAIAREIAGGVS